MIDYLTMHGLMFATLDADISRILEPASLNTLLWHVYRYPIRLSCLFGCTMSSSCPVKVSAIPFLDCKIGRIATGDYLLEFSA